MEPTRKIDIVGRILIPSDIRKALEWDSGSKITVTMQDDSLILRKSQDSCFACGNEDKLMPIHGKFICRACIDELAENHGS